MKTKLYQDKYLIFSREIITYNYGLEYLNNQVNYKKA